MKKFLVNFSLAVAVTFLTLALGQLVHGQQADQDPAPASPQQPEAATQHQNEAQMPASGDTTTREAKTFTGRIVKEEIPFGRLRAGFRPAGENAGLRDDAGGAQG